MSDSLGSLVGYSPWDFPGKSTGVGCHFLLQGSISGTSSLRTIELGQATLDPCKEPLRTVIL